MRNPDLNYPRLASLAKRIKRTLTYVKSEDVKDWDLEDLLIWIDQERKEHYVTVNMLAIANETTIDRWPFNPDFERLEKVVKAEIERRQNRFAPEKSKPVRQAKPPRTFQSCFKNAECMERLLSAAISVKLIVKDGEKYAWIDEGKKSHRLCALWFAAVDAGLIKSRLKNNEATVKALEVFFGFNWSKDTIDNYDPLNDECLRFKSAIEKKLNSLRS